MMNRDEKLYIQQVQKLYELTTNSFRDNPEEGMAILMDLESRLSIGVRYLEEVYIRKVDEQTYQGTVTINSSERMDSSEGVSSHTIHFTYIAPVPFGRLDRHLQTTSRATTIKGKKRKLEQILQLELKAENGKPIKGELYRSLSEYVKGSIPYAIIFLKEDIKKNEKREGIFQIPRTYIDN